MADLNRAHRLQALHRFAQGQSTDRQLSRQLSLRVKAVAQLQVALDEYALDLGHNRIWQRPRTAHCKIFGQEIRLLRLCLGFGVVNTSFLQ
jgi:hypothetical protein